MATTKQDVLRMIEQMPEDSSLESMIYEIYFRQKVDRGLRQLDQGKTVSHEEVKRSVAQWLQSAGQ